MSSSARRALRPRFGLRRSPRRGRPARRATPSSAPRSPLPRPETPRSAARAPPRRPATVSSRARISSSRVLTSRLTTSISFRSAPYSRFVFTDWSCPWYFLSFSLRSRISPSSAFLRSAARASVVLGLLALLARFPVRGLDVREVLRRPPALLGLHVHLDQDFLKEKQPVQRPHGARAQRPAPLSRSVTKNPLKTKNGRSTAPAWTNPRRSEAPAGSEVNSSRPDCRISLSAADLRWVRLDSNQGPAGYEPVALTAELRTPTAEFEG